MLKVCARCERIFIFEKECPKCAFAYYPNAIWVYDNNIILILWRFLTKYSKGR